jgi:hypothetical protein
MAAVSAQAHASRPVMKRLVYTRHDGGVSICAPSLTALAYMTGGGGRWDDIIRWDREFLDRQIAAQAKDSVGEWAAARFVRAMQFGGLTTAEAYGIVRDRFCAHLGTGCELWDVEDVPTGRRYRNAWRRSHNGGPIFLDGRAVLKIDEVEAWQAYERIERENRQCQR